VRLWESLRGSQSQDPTCGIPSQNYSEAVRCCLATLVGGSLFLRGRIIRSARNPTLAPALEIGIDQKEAVILCHLVERREWTYRLSLTVISAFTALVIVGSNFDITTAIAAVGLACLVAAPLSGSRSFQMTSLLRKFTRHAAPWRVPPPDEVGLESFDLSCVGTRRQNVLLYRGFAPFDFAGYALGGWSFVVDIRKRKEATREPDDTRLNIPDLETAIQAALAHQYGTRIEAHELLAIHGVDSDILPLETRPQWSDPEDLRQVQDPNFPYDRFATKLVGPAPVNAPRVCLSPDEISSILSCNPHRARRYLWFSLTDWDGQVALSFFIRFELRGRTLFVESTRTLLPPIPDPTARHGYIIEETSPIFSREFWSAARRAPLDLVVQPFCLLAAIYVSSNAHMPSFYRFVKECRIRLNKGAEPSIRQRVMGNTYQHYFQKAEVDEYLKEFDVIILEELATYLEDCGIDVSDLRNKETTIYNSGILVQGGDVSAQTLAVGKRATSQTTTIVRRAVRGRSHGKEQAREGKVDGIS
jgi:hypothetical protein